MKIHAIAILPKKVIACVMRREDYAVPIENKYPHMTTLLGAWTAVDSNVLMASLFDEGKRDCKERKATCFSVLVSLRREP